MLLIATLSLTGLLFLFLEFFLPGIVMGVVGGILLVASLFLFALNGPGGFGPILLFLAILLAAVYFVIRLAILAVKATGKKGTVLLSADQEGFQASRFPKELIGKNGIAATDLKPSGHIWVEDRAVQALSKEGYIDKGTPIQILGGQGGHLIVKIHTEVSS